MTTYETSLKLNEAGISIEAKHHWHYFAMSKPMLLDQGGKDSFPAPTFEEIWAGLPVSIPHEVVIPNPEKTIKDGRVGYAYIEITEGNIPYTAWYIYFEQVEGVSLAEAAAQLLLWCKENNHL